MSALIRLTCERAGCGEGISSRDIEKVLQWDREHDATCVALKK